MPVYTSDVDEPLATATAESAACSCETCKFLRYEDSKLRGAVVHQYSYRPEWRFRQLAGETPAYYLGVELETSAGHAANNRWVSNELAADMRLPKTLWVAKRDGSVSGPEFASHPATLAYWNSKRNDLSEMFKQLLHAGYRSHNGDTCGMHINISRSAFADKQHLFRFLTLIYDNPNQTLKLSQRTANSARSWAKLQPLRNPAERHAWTDQVGSGPTAGCHDRYVALNAPWGQRRFELRIPRGTLRIDRFFKNLQWTVAAIEFTRTSTVHDARRFGRFAAYVAAHSEQYPDLLAFLQEKGLAA